MKILEARFHPHSKKAGVPIPVARVVCDNARTLVEPIEVPVSRLQPFDAGALMRKLHFLVESATPRPFEQLKTLRSDFWSFAELPGHPSGD